MAKKIDYFIGAEDTPAHRYFDFQLAVIMEASAGGGIEGFLQQISLAVSHQQAKEYDKVTTILGNMMFSIGSAIERQNHIELAHAAMVRQVDEKDVSRLTAEQVLSMLKDENLTIGFLQKAVQAFKKKIDETLAVTHPQYTPQGLETELAIQVRQRTLLQLKGIKTGNMEDEAIKSVETLLLSMHEPKLLGGSDGVVVKHKKDFDNLCHVLRSYGYTEPEVIPIFRFYNALDRAKKKG